MNVLVTGSSGLVGSEAVSFFVSLGFAVTGVDNNMRADFFGPGGDTTWVRDRLLATCRRFRHRDLDVRDREGVLELLRGQRFELILHAAAQPSHDLAARRPFDDFDVNATGTLNLLEACRRSCPDAVFVHMSTNKVYGDGPNRIALRELETRFEYADPRYQHGIPEDFPIDGGLHSLFGVSKAASDLLAQEYARYFGLKVGIFRGGCLTGSRHSGVELHGFLNYLILTALRGAPYTVFGHKGKQVRDQIHGFDVVRAAWSFAQDPAVVDLVADVLGPDVRFHSSKLNFKWSEGGDAVRWHQDIQAWPHTSSSVLTFGVYLEDTGLEQGPLTALPGTHHGPLYEQFDDDGRWTGALADDLAESRRAPVADQHGSAAYKLGLARTTSTRTPSHGLSPGARRTIVRPAPGSASARGPAPRAPGSARAAAPSRAAAGGTPRRA